MYEYCPMMKRKNGKFTFGGLNVVLSMDGGMGRYSYIAQSIAWGYLGWRLAPKGEIMCLDSKVVEYPRCS
ncbi:hypothetical protein MTR67_030745 [Solanum verrucosum]|uniref:Uncharacterized protein n=1 Tax=Solanum verrucosum TaxID=315347 RepID=A0AAF0U165_SOLVR|nr:hypothetical protein MTR67_030745 [Solanum verrucosum]